jgi:hypothetical protein
MKRVSTASPQHRRSERGRPPASRLRAPYVEADLAMYDVSRGGRFAIVAGETNRSRVVVALDALGANAARERGRRERY